jgi:hypothetical protein
LNSRMTIMTASRRREPLMKDFADAAFEPEIIEAMTSALERAVASLPEPVSSSHVRQLAESILRTAKSGEASADVLARIALLELRITPRD